MGIELRHWGGEMARPGEDAGPIGHRHVPFSIVAGGQAETPEDAERMMAGVRTVADKLRPHATGGSFLNFLGDPARTAERVHGRRLRAAAAGQGRVRPGQRVRGQPQHPAGLGNLLMRRHAAGSMLAA